MMEPDLAQIGSSEIGRAHTDVRMAFRTPGAAKRRAPGSARFGNRSLLAHAATRWRVCEDSASRAASRAALREMTRFGSSRHPATKRHATTMRAPRSGGDTVGYFGPFEASRNTAI